MGGKRYLFILSIITSLFMLTACTVSEEEVKEHAQQFFEMKLEEKETKSITYEDDIVQLYVPSFTEVERLDDYNLLFEREDQVFLLFVHQDLAADDEEELLKQLMIEKEPFILEMKKNGDKISYFVVVESDEDEYITIVGHDQFKLTTITTLGDLTDTAEMMFDIVKSASMK